MRYSKNESEYTFVIGYPANFTIPGITLLNKLLTPCINPANNIVDNYKLPKFYHEDFQQTVITLRPR